MASFREWYFTHRRKSDRVRKYLTWHLYFVGVGGALFTASLVTLTTPYNSPAVLTPAAAILIWSIPAWVRWRNLTWTVRLTVGAATAFGGELVWRFLEPTWFVFGRELVFAIVICTWAGPWLVLPLARWHSLTWAKRLAYMAGIVFAASLVLISMGAPKSLVGMPVAFAIWSFLPLFRWQRWTWTKRLIALAAVMLALLVAAEATVSLFMATSSAYFGRIAAFIILILLPLAFLSYIAALLSRITAPPATWALIILGIVFLYSFPPLLAFLAVNGNVNDVNLALQPNPGGGWPGFWLSFLQSVLLAIVPLVLIALPEILRRELGEPEDSTTVETLLLSQLTIVAALATGLYTASLHFAKGPLRELSASQLIFAAVAVVVLLSPFYKFVITASWKHGVAEVFDPRNWLARQRELLRLIRKAFTGQIQEETHDGSTSGSPISLATETLPDNESL